MKIASISLLTGALVISGAAFPAIPGAGAAARADEAVSLSGDWKLVVLAFGEDEFAIVKVDQKDGKTSASVASAQKMLLGDTRVEMIGLKDGVLTIELAGGTGVSRFVGKLVKGGPHDGKVLGHFTFRGEIYPARLERTESREVGELKPSPLINAYVAAMRDRDPKSKIKKLQDAIKSHPASPTNHLFYTELLGAAEAGGLPAAEVGELVKIWLNEAEIYGTPWLNEVRLKALKALGASKPFSDLSLTLAQDADKLLGEEASLEQKAAVVGLLARAARNAGKADIARMAEERSARLEGRLDEEYHKKVPPFKPAAFAGRKSSKADKVVLMELFTGAQCPPCVAADVGFDALLKTYKPTEFIGLQYHLHIPGPDPLTNTDSVARQQYYGDEVRGTPSTFFNGHPEAGGGGGMQGSEGKYNEYREIIDRQLESGKGATIDLSATRAGDQLEIKARARVLAQAKADKGDQAKEKDKAKGDDKKKEDEPAPKPRLRLVLTEESVRYLGGNKLRFHHHVVRDFPGGTEGKDLSSGEGQLNVKLDLTVLKKDIESYLSTYAKVRSFPGTLPEIALRNLAVVAFVQDDADRSILHAVSVPVEEIKP